MIHPTTTTVAWTLICLIGWLVNVTSLYQLWFRVRPSLIRRGAWDHLGVRQVVRQYLRRDVARTVRLFGFVLIGVATLFTRPPVHTDTKATVSLAALVLIVAVVVELMDTILDFRYRQSWWRPGERALRYPMATDIPDTESDG